MLKILFFQIFLLNLPADFIQTDNDTFIVSAI